MAVQIESYPPDDSSETRPSPDLELSTKLGNPPFTPEQSWAPSDAYQKVYDPSDGDLEVHVTSHLTLTDYEALTPPEAWADLLAYADKMQGKTIVRINATAAGGGVAIMNAPWVHVMQSLGVDAHWYALEPNEKAAEVTKWKFHNVLQDVGDPAAYLTEEDKATYNTWIARNQILLEQPIRKADVLLIDDWQPSGLIPYIKGYTEETLDGSIHHLGLNPHAPILFRDHIHTEGAKMVTPGTRQNITWDFLWNHNRIKDADVFITHPRDIFVPDNVPNEKVIFMPATIDLLDDLNRELTDPERQAGLDFINQQLALNEGQSPIDMNRPYIVLVARFDESKGMPQGMEAYAKARQKLRERGVPAEEIPQFVMVGNGSVDDPSGTFVLSEIMNLRRTEYDDIKSDIKVARVPHNDVAINALLGGAYLALQPSTKEGFEARVTDAIKQGVPTIGSTEGGIPLQIKHGETGFIANPHDIELWADYMADMVTNTPYYRYLKEQTAQQVEGDSFRYTTVANLTRWLILSHVMLDSSERQNFNGQRRWAEDLAA